MLIELTEKELQELEDLREIFEDCYNNDVKVECFDFISKVVSDKIDVETLSIEEREVLINQLIESEEFLLCLNCKVYVIKKLIECIRG